MSQVFHLSDQAYAALQEIAAAQGSTPEGFIEAWLVYQSIARQPGERNPYSEPHYYTTDEWFRHLGMTDEEIASALEEDESDANA